MLQKSTLSPVQSSTHKSAAGFPLFYWQKKIQDFSRTPMRNFPGPSRSPQMLKYKEKSIHLQNIQGRMWRTYAVPINRKSTTVSGEHCKFSSAVHGEAPAAVDFSGFWTNRKMCNFQGYFSRTFQDQSDFPGLSRTKVIFQDFPDSAVVCTVMHALYFSSFVEVHGV